MLKLPWFCINERQSAPELETLTPHPWLLNSECAIDKYLIRYSHGDHFALQVVDTSASTFTYCGTDRYIPSARHR